jgi:hypothetical protein
MTTQKTCQKCNTNFPIDEQDTSFYEKMKVPEPTFCPDCRFQRRLVWRNERSLYKRTCDGTGESIFSTYPQDSKFTVYSSKYWSSDAWDAMDYGRDYDFSRPFFEQYRELLEAVPKRAVFNIEDTMVNSQYTNLVTYLKNCYLLFNSDYNEECMYGTENQNSKNCIDNKFIDACEFCYECVNCQNCYQTFFSQDCSNCSNVWMSRDCSNCQNCFGCVNMKGASYCIFNEQYSKEEYEQKLAEMNLGSYEALQDLQKDFYNFEIQHPVKFMHGRQNHDVTGDYIYNSKNVHNSYMVYDAQDVRYSWMLVLPGVKDIYDYSEYGGGAELIYDSVTCGQNVSNLRFCGNCLTGCQDLQYCFDVRKSTSLFGCVGVKDQKFCILNKQYTEEEYNELVPKIIEHMNEMPYVDANGVTYGYGEFFPAEISNYAYNESSAQEYFPLTKEEILDSAFRYKEVTQNQYATTMHADELPDRAEDVDEEILNQIIECKETGRAYRITAGELSFCQQMNLPLPRTHQDVRFKERFQSMNGTTFYQRTTEDGVDVLTTYSPDDPHRILSHEGYKAEVY